MRLENKHWKLCQYRKPTEVYSSSKPEIFYYKLIADKCEYFPQKIADPAPNFKFVFHWKKFRQSNLVELYYVCYLDIIRVRSNKWKRRIVFTNGFYICSRLYCGICEYMNLICLTSTMSTVLFCNVGFVARKANVYENTRRIW